MRWVERERCEQNKLMAANYFIYNFMQKNNLYYYLLPQQVVSFETIDHSPSTVHLQEIAHDHSSEAVFNALKYRYSLKCLGKECEDLFVLCIPAHEHQVCHSNRMQEGQQRRVVKLIKTSKETQLKGYLSGRRSAILIEGEKLIRYKGCGNDLEGFIFENKGLRGSHFYHTAKRELYMTNLINQILQKEIKEPSANLPLCFYEFPNDLTQWHLKNELRLLRKYCCVFETKGDRRVGTHLISPLEIIFLNIVAVQSGIFDDFFKQRQRLDQFGIVELLTDFELFLDNGEKFLDKYDKSKQFANYVTISDYETATNQKLKQSENVMQFIQQIVKSFVKSNDTVQYTELQTITNWIDVINIILQKIGWQMGEVKRIFCQSQINWGFFNDHGYWHCNAHLNNFVTKIPTSAERFILPLDFDLAFTKDEYINIDLQSPLYGQKDDQNFEQFLLSEYNAMEMSVSGLQIMNFKYSIGSEEFNPSQEIKQARVIFRDTLIKSFRSGMRRNKEQYQKINTLWDENIVNIKKLIQLCLIVSADFQT